jgi:hypothetical protein
MACRSRDPWGCKLHVDVLKEEERRNRDEEVESIQEVCVSGVGCQ